MFEKSIKLIDIQTIVVSLIVIAVCLLRVVPHINNFSPIIALAIFSSLHFKNKTQAYVCLLYTSPSPRDVEESRMPSSA